MDIYSLTVEECYNLKPKTPFTVYIPTAVIAAAAEQLGVSAEEVQRRMMYDISDTARRCVGLTYTRHAKDFGPERDEDCFDGEWSEWEQKNIDRQYEVVRPMTEPGECSEDEYAGIVHKLAEEAAPLAPKEEHEDEVACDLAEKFIEEGGPNAVATIIKHTGNPDIVAIRYGDDDDDWGESAAAALMMAEDIRDALQDIREAD